jgi:hypothetical protein
MQEQEKSLLKYSEMVESTIDLEELDRHNFVIKPDYDPGLKEISGRLLEVGIVDMVGLLLAHWSCRCETDWMPSIAKSAASWV